jgi:hypothetical protein
MVGSMGLIRGGRDMFRSILIVVVLVKMGIALGVAEYN